MRLSDEFIGRNFGPNGQYKIEKKLGEGGMGVVFKARDRHLDRIVAMKVLRRRAHELRVMWIAQQCGRIRDVHPAHLVHLVVRREGRRLVLRLHQPVADGLVAPLVVPVPHRRQLGAEPAP